MMTFQDKVARLMHEHEVLVTAKNEPVASGNRFVLCRNQLFVLVHQSGHFVLKSHHQILFV